MAQTARPPLAISTRTNSASRLDAIAMYPNSPIGVFPPPAPPTRRTLRDRCGVDLTLKIDAPFRPSKVPALFSPKGHVQPHRNNLPRRRNPKKCFANFHDKADKAAIPVRASQPPKPTTSIPVPLPTPYQPPKPEEPHLQAIIPAVWVGFGHKVEGDFTHVVEICHAGEMCAGGSMERHQDSSAQRLKLVLPESAREQTGRAALALTDTQLQAARDFMAESLPQTLAALPDQTDIRVLVRTPPGRPTDAMCVMGCYLAFVAGRDVESILQCIDEEESVLSVWKGEVSGEEMERIENIARKTS